MEADSGPVTRMRKIQGRTMIRLILLTAGTLSTLAAGSIFAGHPDGSADTATDRLVATPTVAATAARDVLSDTVAAAVIGSVERQFNATDVTVQLGEVAMHPASVQDREVHAAGRLRFGVDTQWIPFEVVALYDTRSAEVTYPRLSLGVHGKGSADAAPELAGSLDGQVVSALETEFAGQPVAWSRETASMSGGADRFVHLQATGVADFGDEGAVPTRVDALYDRQTGRWLRVSYELGAEYERADTAPLALL